ncbi:MAG: MarR family winged helix-turn-helix transcriptional regulator [Eubacteriales bacterium]|nr:MarR family winged helix-turn-helix transcriptional regulator [Eubacteriales bacterium]
MQQPIEVLLLSSKFKKLYDKKIGKMAEHYGLTSNEVNILLFLVNNPGYDTAKDISELRLLPKACVSRSVDSLIRQGFLTSHEDEKDRRILHLSILPAAQSLVEDAQTSQQEFFSCIYRNFSESERRMLNALTDKVLINMKEELEKC